MAAPPSDETTGAQAGEGPHAGEAGADAAPRSTDTPRPASTRGQGLDPIGAVRGRAPLFLHRETYRHRRVMDAARLLPLFGTALLLLPLLWAEDHATASGAVYLFLAWFGLIVAAGLLARRLAAPLRARDHARVVPADPAASRADGGGGGPRRAPARDHAP
ncbi:MAG: hypothetical protein V2I65_03230 [Paracoccaceae bacterium]|jgi:hypothetical protein|nr:hypothetical protein [Paracoccaceae bacterium]